MAFRFSVIERLPDPATIWTVKGTFVHRVLEQLFWRHPRGERTPEAAEAEFALAWPELLEDEEFRSLELDEEATARLAEECRVLVHNEFRLEDPNAVDAIGLELMLEAQIGGVKLRGILDRLDRREDGELVVIDYKTGRAPSAKYEQAKLSGVHLYAVLCEEVLGRTPVEVRLLHLKEPTIITATPTAQSLRGHRTKTAAVWTAIDRACQQDDFRPRTGPLCNYCRYREFCPAFGGDPALAAAALSPTVPPTTSDPSLLLSPTA